MPFVEVVRLSIPIQLRDTSRMVPSQESLPDLSLVLQLFLVETARTAGESAVGAVHLVLIYDWARV